LIFGGHSDTAIFFTFSIVDPYSAIAGETKQFKTSSVWELKQA